MHMSVVVEPVQNVWKDPIKLIFHRTYNALYGGGFKGKTFNVDVLIKRRKSVGL